MQTNIIVTLQYEATHCWPSCDLEEVEFLKYSHRHVFFITLKKQVMHDDRDIEIILFKRSVLEWLHRTYGGKLGSMSCEQLAKILCKQFNCCYASVKEDNECGAEVIQYTLHKEQ